MREKAHLLDDIADFAAQFGHFKTVNLGATDPNLPAGRFVKAINHLHEGGFAATAWSQQYDKVAFLHVQADFIYRRTRRARKILAYPVELDNTTQKGLPRLS